MTKGKWIDRVIFRVRAIKTKSYVARKSDIMINKSVNFDRWCYFTARGGKIIISKNTFLNSQVILNADLGGLIHISQNCIIGPRVIMRTANHNYSNIFKPKRSQGHSVGSIKIGENVWIGAGVTVLPGVTIGDNTVIGAGAVVSRNIPNNCVAVGIPAKIIKNLA